MAGEKKSVNNGIATLRIRRVANGLEIFIQSEVLEKFFSNLPDSGYGPLEGLKAYYFAEEVAPRLVFKRFKFFGGSFIKARDETALSGAKPGNEVFDGPLAS